MRIIALFNLKPGVTREQYESWARSRDLPTVRSLPSIAAFDVLRTTGTLSGDAAPYEYVEIIDVKDMERFGVDVAADPMPAIAAEFAAHADATFILTEAL
nr:REDY-like protein HapK [Sphingomonas sp. Y57]